MRRILFNWYLLLFIFIITSQFITAQENFKEAYIITLDSDTIYGQADYRNYEYLSQKCTFKSKQGEVIQYLPGSIKSFRFIDGKYYVSKSIEGETLFLEYIIDGEVDLYFRRKEGKDYFYMQKEGEKLVELPKKEMVYTADGRLVYERKYVGLLNYYMGDAPKLKYRIQNFEDIDHRNLTKLAKDYHNYVCEDGECIIFEENKRGISINVELFGGVLNFRNYIIPDELDNNYYQQGLMLHVWLPRSNDKLYLRAGVEFLRIEFEGASGFIRKIPIQLEYIYPKGLIRPKFSYGINIYNNSSIFDFNDEFLNSFMIGATIGIDIVFSEKLSAAVYSDLDFYSSDLFLPKELLSKTISFGIMYKIETNWRK